MSLNKNAILRRRRRRADHLQEDDPAGKEEESESPLTDKCLNTAFWWVPTSVQFFFDFNMRNSLPESSWIEDPSELPKLFKILTAIVYNLTYFALALYFFYITYKAGRERTFVSLDDSAGDCTEVGRPTSGVFHGLPWNHTIRIVHCMG